IIGSLDDQHRFLQMLRRMLHRKTLLVGFIIFEKLIVVRHLLFSPGIFRVHHTRILPMLKPVPRRETVAEVTYACKRYYSFYSVVFKCLDYRNSGATAVADHRNSGGIDFRETAE